MAPFSNWIALLSTPFLVQDFVVHALPNPESLLDQRSSGAAPAPRVLLPRGRNAIDGLTSTDLVKREPAEPPASNGVPGKHSTTHTTGREHRVGGKPPSPNQQKAVAKGRHPPQTRLTAIEAARGGTVIKSGSDQVGSAKPAGKGLGESKIGLGDPPHPAPAENPCARFPMETDVDFVGTVYYSLIKGAVHQLSEPECPPGSIGHTYSFSTSWSVSGQIGPDMKATLPGLTRFKKYLDKLGIRAGVAYSWTRYSGTLPRTPLELFLFVFCILFTRGMESTASANDV
ncbi:hypothetical protein CB0940_05390 [Cercospora beticola]|uniref:Uncharacterized protein n=1 Tax=Cercospora beticola TaxID=122368 RepID=A0A2G5I0K7_CERBT|nr:hypothetical protein CB0940_05390 [Cercospora beticola]PIA98329.1 hypothetical protein CB0940_05390 [Cercospora beticola]WPA97931.1 hypothetical protein RHO25_002542 [Cercospora beticola]